MRRLIVLVLLANLGGHLSILGRARPIDELLADPAPAPELKQCPERVVTIRARLARQRQLPALRRSRTAVCGAGCLRHRRGSRGRTALARRPGRAIVSANSYAIVSIGVYHTHVPTFEALLTRHDGDLKLFYAAVAKLAQLPSAEHNAILTALG